MSYSVSVLVPTISSELQKALEVSNTVESFFSTEEGFYLSSERVASEQEMCSFWHKPAKDLGLSLLEGVYEKGFQSSNAGEIQRLAYEVDKLEAYWKENIVDEEVYGGTRLSRLTEGARHIKAATALALKWNGRVNIA